MVPHRGSKRASHGRDAASWRRQSFGQQTLQDLTWGEASYGRGRRERVRGCSARERTPRRTTDRARGSSDGTGHEPASGSGDPMPMQGDMVPVVNEASGIPNLQEPMLVSQAVICGAIFFSPGTPLPTPEGQSPSPGCQCPCSVTFRCTWSPCRSITWQ